MPTHLEEQRLKSEYCFCCDCSFCMAIVLACPPMKTKLSLSNKLYKKGKRTANFRHPDIANLRSVRNLNKKKRWKILYHILNVKNILIVFPSLKSEIFEKEPQILFWRMECCTTLAAGKTRAQLRVRWWLKRKPNNASWGKLTGWIFVELYKISMLCLHIWQLQTVTYFFARYFTGNATRVQVMPTLEETKRYVK